MTRAANILLALFFLATGCHKPHPAADGRIIFLLPGVAGDGGRYSDLTEAIESTSDCDVQTISWGAPFPLFMLNFSNRGIHNDAEAKLAEVIVNHRKDFPASRIDLVGHSAGCGMILGGIKRLPADQRVNTIVLLAPSVSPKYDLAQAIAKVDGNVHVFSSSLDTVFLKWRTGHFGTYDNIKTPAAGNVGFDLSSLPPTLRAKVIAHPYDISWKNLGNDGGHFGATSDRFARTIIAPLFARDLPAGASPSR